MFRGVIKKGVSKWYINIFMTEIVMDLLVYAFCEAVSILGSQYIRSIRNG